MWEEKGCEVSVESREAVKVMTKRSEREEV